MKKLVHLFIVLLILSCKSETTEEFSFSGTTTGIIDGTKMILDNIDTGTILDSTIVQNNSFLFEGDLPSSPLRAVLRTSDYSHYRYVWLENNTMTFDASKSDFRNAVIKGSESENLNQHLSKLVSEIEPHSEAQSEVEQKFVGDNPNSIVSANILSIYATTWGKETTKSLFDKLSIENKNSRYGEKISTYIKLNKEPKIGEGYVDFVMEDENGKNIKLSNNTGKITLLEFWASWCGPCRKEIPNLVKTYEKYNSKGFEIFAVSLDDNNENWKDAIKKDSLNWQHASDLKGNENVAGLIYGVNGIPDNFLIDENGIIVGRNLRGDRLNKKT
ncbi:TlpA disulfide reductase family protein [uncultured Winogradskyella sp.]|uniref:TlpA disulfide reductase family protein n=1 Tax=uncultured Winogradskyella sp. TaxID=395353 RepID=UPI00261C0CF5|nr:TlpA disulfide reductase family protein [uncultured Winogradskyella sp.]